MFKTMSYFSICHEVETTKGFVEGRMTFTLQVRIFLSSLSDVSFPQKSFFYILFSYMYIILNLLKFIYEDERFFYYLSIIKFFYYLIYMPLFLSILLPINLYTMYVYV